MPYQVNYICCPLRLTFQGNHLMTLDVKTVRGSFNKKLNKNAINMIILLLYNAVYLHLPL